MIFFYIGKSFEGVKQQAPTPVSSKHPGIDQEEFENMKAEIDRLRKLLDERFNQLLQLLDRKADKDDLDHLEKRIMDRINEIIKSLLDRFADKKDTLRRLTNIEKQIKTLFDLIMNQESHRNGTEDDAMFTKKPLGGISCASCEKNITNLSGQMAEYQPWKRLPFKEPGERISRYGPGFSKILQMLRPERSVESTTVDLQSVNTRHANSIHNSVEEVLDSVISGPYHGGSAVNSPQREHAGQHYDHILPKATGATPNSKNARTTVNFFRSVHNNSNNVFAAQTQGSRDSHRGLGGGWAGGAQQEEQSPAATRPGQGNQHILIYFANDE